jgi:signal transduction histidine kinase
VRAQALGELGDAVTHLSWLAPHAASLVALSRPHLTSWSSLRTDPGCVLLVARYSAAANAVTAFTPAMLRDPQLLQAARRHLDEPGGVDWEQSVTRPIYQAALTYAELAERLAKRINRVDPEFAWMAGLIAPLGWLAVCAVNAESAAHCLAAPAQIEQAAATECQRWGFDQAAIGRRLARRWALPAWLSTIVGHLALPVDIAEGLGADRELFRLVQLAVGLAQGRQSLLRLDVGKQPQEIAVDLGLSAADLDELQKGESFARAEPHIRAEDRLGGSLALPTTDDSTSVSLLQELLALAEENRRLAECPVLERLEREMDELHQALARQRASEISRLQTAKLCTLAEFAAGAGHEINNPLAVISGQAQYLLGHLQIADCEAPQEGSDPAPQNMSSALVEKALRTIIGQAQRIHEMLTQLMQFARPARPQKRMLDLNNLIREVVIELRDLADQRRVRLECPESDLPLRIQADPRQLHMALTCLLRNAIEAAPPDGWAGIRLTTPTADPLEILVEDNGTGPTPQQLEHIFDPFYSGRQAGRGRGLGLPTAWRLAREHGGDVSFEAQAHGPTRFILSLPRDVASDTRNNHAAISVDRASPAFGEGQAKAG